MPRHKVEGLDQVKANFALRMNTILKVRGLSESQLAQITGISSNRISAWITATNMPEYPELIRFSEKLGVSKDWLLSPDPFDQSDVPLYEPIIMMADNHYEEAREKIISGTHRILFVQLRTGASLVAKSIATPLVKIMRDRDVVVHLLICNPDDTLSLQMVAARRDSMSKDITIIGSNIRDTIGQFQNYAIKAEKPNNLHIKLTHCPSTTFTYISDPPDDEKEGKTTSLAKNGKVLARMVNFQDDDFSKSPMITISEAKHESVFGYFVQDFNRLWEKAIEYHPSIQK